MPFLFIYLFIQTYLYRVKTLLAFGYFAYVPCFMTSICMKSENTKVKTIIIILCTIVTITKIEGTLDILDHNPMIYAFALIE